MHDEFTYLGYLLRYDGNETPNLEMRFTKANAAFSCLRKIWSNKTYLPQELKIRVFNSIVLSCTCMQVKSGHSILKLVVLFAHGTAEKCH